MSREQLRRRRRRPSRPAAAEDRLRASGVDADPARERALERAEELLTVIDVVLAEHPTVRGR